MAREPNIDSAPTGLEQSCIEPGHWLIEGYDVCRLRLGGWSIRLGPLGGVLHLARTLAEARDWIAQKPNQEGNA